MPLYDLTFDPAGADTPTTGTPGTPAVFTEQFRVTNRAFSGTQQFGNYFNGFMCFHRTLTPLSGTIPTTSPAGTIWRVRAIGVTGTFAATAAVGVTGALTIQDLTSGGHNQVQVCFNNLNTVTPSGDTQFGTVHTQSASGWGNATWIIERQTSAGTPGTPGVNGKWTMRADDGSAPATAAGNGGYGQTAVAASVTENNYRLQFDPLVPEESSGFSLLRKLEWTPGKYRLGWSTDANPNAWVFRQNIAHSQDFDTLIAAGNTAPQGIYSDGTTMWVADITDSRIYAYVLATKLRDMNKDFNTLDAAQNNSPRGLWTDGTTMWVADSSDGKIYAYNMSDKQRNADEDFNTLASTVSGSNASPQGIWSNGTIMWVVESRSHDGFTDKIFAYNMSDKTRNVSQDFNTLEAAGNGTPRGIWSDGTTMWLSDFIDGKIYAYVLATKARDATKDYNTLIAAGNTVPTGIWSDGTTTMWVVDSTDDKIYSYTFPPPIPLGTRITAEDFNTLIAAENRAPFGIWSDGTTMWVADFDDAKIYAYNMSDKQRNASQDFDTLIAAENRAPFGILTDGVTMWVSDYADDKIYAYNISNKQRNASQDFNTLSAAGNNSPRGIWTDGTTMWVSDAIADKIYAYNISDKARDSTKDFNTLSAAGNSNPRGIWSDGTTMWVSDAIAAIIYAYNMSDKARDMDKDLNFSTLNDAGNNRPQGIWSNGTTMWVADSSDDKIYAYNIGA